MEREKGRLLVRTSVLFFFFKGEVHSSLFKNYNLVQIFKK